MKPRSLRSLMALERVRKLHEDEARLELAVSLREQRLAEDASRAGEGRLDNLADMKGGCAQEAAPMEMGRYLFLATRYQEELDAQERLDSGLAATKGRLETSIGGAADAWKNHAAAASRKKRHAEELRRLREREGLDELNGLWLARRERNAHD